MRPGRPGWSKAKGGSFALRGRKGVCRVAATPERPTRRRLGSGARRGRRAIRTLTPLAHDSWAGLPVAPGGRATQRLSLRQGGRRLGAPRQSKPRRVRRPGVPRSPARPRRALPVPCGAFWRPHPGVRGPQKPLFLRRTATDTPAPRLRLGYWVAALARRRGDKEP